MFKILNQEIQEINYQKSQTPRYDLDAPGHCGRKIAFSSSTQNGKQTQTLSSWTKAEIFQGEEEIREMYTYVYKKR